MEGVSFLFSSERISQWSKVFPATSPSCPHPVFQTTCSQKDIWFQWKLSWHPCNMLRLLLCASWEGWGLLRGFWVIGLVASSCQEIKRQPRSGCCCMWFNGFVFTEYSAASQCQKYHYWRHANEKCFVWFCFGLGFFCKISLCLKRDRQPPGLWNRISRCSEWHLAVCIIHTQLFSKAYIEHWRQGWSWAEWWHDTEHMLPWARRRWFSKEEASSEWAVHKVHIGLLALGICFLAVRLVHPGHTLQSSGLWICLVWFLPFIVNY